MCEESEMQSVIDKKERFGCLTHRFYGQKKKIHIVCDGLIITKIIALCGVF
jgi:hypothetical protein